MTLMQLKQQEAKKSWMITSNCFLKQIVAVLCLAITSTFAFSSDIQIALESSLSKTNLNTNHPALISYYTAREFKPRWSDSNLHWEQALDIVDHLQYVTNEGLSSEDYHIDAIETRLAILEKTNYGSNVAKLKEFVELELLITDALMRYLDTLNVGYVSSANFPQKWFKQYEALNFTDLLDNKFISNDLTELFQEVFPLYENYYALTKALKHYLSVKQLGGWPAIAANKPTLKPGMTDPRIILIKIRLFLGTDLKSLDEEESYLFDETLETAVKSFQKRHGLVVDGAIGKKTLEAMNIPVEQRIEQLKVNLERWRWLPKNLGERYVIVNAAGFYLTYYENNQESLSMKVIVGRKSRETPVFTDNIDYLVFNPSWYVPRNIAAKDLLPKIKKNPGFLEGNRYDVYQDGVKVDASTVKWEDYSLGNFPFKLQQRPGSNNALGSIKFKFPNRHQVYLHDTPDKSLFDKPKRLYSSGCVRVEKPFQLAEALLKDESQWNTDTISDTIISGKRQVVNFDKPIPIYLLYWTNWVDKDYNVYFMNDHYNRDQQVAQALRH